MLSWRTIFVIGVVAFATAKLADRHSPTPALTRANPATRRAAPINTAARRDFIDHPWAALAHRIFQSFLDDRVMAVAAGVTFYAMLALFPALASMISLYGLIGDPKGLANNVQGLYGIVPGGGIDIIRGEIASLTSNPPAALGLGFLLGLAISLWSANAGVKALFDALNVVYHEREKRSYLRLTLISFAFTFGLLGVVIAATFAVLIVPIALNFVGYGDEAATTAALSLLRWPIMLVMVGLALSFIYRYGPSRPQSRWQWISWGSVFASVMWVLTSLLFSQDVAHFGSYNKTYGSLGAAMGFMTWIWLSAIVVLLGAEVNAELEGSKEK